MRVDERKLFGEILASSLFVSHRLSSSLLIGLALAACNRAPEAPAPPSRSGRVAVANRVRLFYEIQGQGDTLILIHGGFTDRRIWNEQMDELSRDFTEALPGGTESFTAAMRDGMRQTLTGIKATAEA